MYRTLSTRRIRVYLMQVSMVTLLKSSLNLATKLFLVAKPIQFSPVLATVTSNTKFNKQWTTRDFYVGMRPAGGSQFRGQEHTRTQEFFVGRT